jgi:hypothetical protein
MMSFLSRPVDLPDLAAAGLPACRAHLMASFKKTECGSDAERP